MTRHLGPLTLDAGASIVVPGGINTYLREYQRDGVRFFFDRWKEGRGGLLGDDMGLVSVFDTPLFVKRRRSRAFFAGQNDTSDRISFGYHAQIRGCTRYR
jgi:hypothetical protein